MTTPGARANAAPPVPGVVIRSIRPDDATCLRAFQARLSDDTIRNRFFRLHRALPDAEVHRSTSPTPGNKAALVVTVDEEIVAVGRYIRLGVDGVAEVAFVVQEGYQGHGIATALLTLLERIAWDDGIRCFVADTLAAKWLMLDIFMHTPQAVTVIYTRQDGPVVHLVMGVVPAENRRALVADPAERSRAERRRRAVEVGR
jgi:GNAT superfamily N-acetyltransferase